MVSYTTDNGPESAPGVWSGPVSTRTGGPSSIGLSAGQRQSVSSQGGSATMSASAFGKLEPRSFGDGNQYIEDFAGFLIPTSYFHRVATLIRNTKGEPIPEATKVFATDRFPVGSDVVNSTAVLRLLRLRYSDFILLAEAKDKEADYVWYQATDTEIASNESKKVLTFEETPIKSSGGIGISLGSDITIG